MDETIQSVHECSEDIEVMESFTCLGSVMHSSSESCQGV